MLKKNLIFNLNVRMKCNLWWNIQVIFSKLIYDPLLLDFLTVLPPNKFSWELEEYKKQYMFNSDDTYDTCSNYLESYIDDIKKKAYKDGQKNPVRQGNKGRLIEYLCNYKNGKISQEELLKLIWFK